MNVLIVMPYPRDTVPGQRFRIEQWAALLEREGVSFEFVPFASTALKQVMYRPGHLFQKAWAVIRCMASRFAWAATLDRKRWDAIFIYREALPIGPPVLEWFLARTGIPIVYDFDDAIFLPTVSDANRSFGWLKSPRKTGLICRLSTHVAVGNDYLRQYALRFNSGVTVVPTTIDDDKYTMKPGTGLQDPPVIGWSGSLTTIKHLETITETLQVLRRSMNFRLKVVGGPGPSVPGLEVEAAPWTASTEISSLQDFDIGVMPLPDDEWSRGKCGLKALQYMALGIPVVASPVGVNSEIIEDGRNGFLAASPSEWIDKLSRLLVEPDLRRRFAEEGRRTVAMRYAARIHAPRVLTILQDAILHNKNGKRRADLRREALE